MENGIVRAKNSAEHEESIQQKWSMLMDGELDEASIDALLNEEFSDEDAAADWETYHLIGDVLRSADLAESYVNLKRVEHAEKMSQQLAAEPLILAPTKQLKAAGEKKPFHLPNWSGWLVASGFAVLAMVSVIDTNSGADQYRGVDSGHMISLISNGLVAVQQNRDMTQKVAKGKSPDPVLVQPVAFAQMIKDMTKNQSIAHAGDIEAGLESYRLAHQQFEVGGTLAERNAQDYYLQVSGH